MPVKSFLGMLATTLMNFNNNAGLEKVVKEFEQENHNYRSYSEHQIDKKLKEASTK